MPLFPMRNLNAIIMKKTLITLASAVAFMFAACTKSNDNNQYLQPHDANRMMDTMHAIMSRMDAIPKTNLN
jgi:hypothetical protein